MALAGILARNDLPGHSYGTGKSQQAWPGLRRSCLAPTDSVPWQVLVAANGSTLLLAVQHVCQLPVPPCFSVLVRMDLWRQAHLMPPSIILNIM